MYPLAFEPIFKETIWGGSAISSFKGIAPPKEGVGESWEISHVAGNHSMVANGKWAGKSLGDLIQLHGKELLGGRIAEEYQNKLPLLLKLIDARTDLSVQVHPDDDLACKRHNSMGKTELWYVIEAAPGACLYAGFLPTDREDFVKRVADNTLVDILQRHEVKAGDVFYLPAGQVHAIGAGCFVAEIQQTSDITYRIYDYNRTDDQGHARQLHIQEALDAIRFDGQVDSRQRYDLRMNQPVLLASCNYFTAQILALDKPIVRDFTSMDSFVMYLCIAGQGTIMDDQENTTPVRQGQSVLVPACTNKVTITPSADIRLLEFFVA